MHELFIEMRCTGPRYLKFVANFRLACEAARADLSNRPAGARARAHVHARPAAGRGGRGSSSREKQKGAARAEGELRRAGARWTCIYLATINCSRAPELRLPAAARARPKCRLAPDVGLSLRRLDNSSMPVQLLLATTLAVILSSSRSTTAQTMQPMEFNVSSPRAVEWPACGGQCNPTGAPIFSVQVPGWANGALSWMITSEAHDQGTGGRCMGVKLEYTPPGRNAFEPSCPGCWQQGLGGLPHSYSNQPFVSSSPVGKQFNVSANGTLVMTADPCWGGALYMEHTVASFKVCVDPWLRCLAALTQGCNAARQQSVFQCGICAGSAAVALHSAGCSETEIGGFCANQTCGAKLVSLCGPARQASSYDCGLCVGSNQPALTECTAVQEKEWCTQLD